MPNFDGNGPLKRGRVIGRGRGPCKQTTPERPREDTNLETQDENETPAQ
jgi:hypothetical protein